MALGPRRESGFSPLSDGIVWWWTGEVALPVRDQPGSSRLMQSSSPSGASAGQVQYDIERVYGPYRSFRPVGPHPRPEHWAAVRSVVLARDGHQCRMCSAKAGDVIEGWGLVRLEVHHRHYRNWGRELPDDLTTLCRRCHQGHTEHVMRERDRARTITPLPVAAVGCDRLPVSDPTSIFNIKAHDHRNESRSGRNPLWGDPE